MASLEQLVTMGFSEDEARTAVEAHGVGALDILLGVSSPAPHQASPRVLHPRTPAVDTTAVLCIACRQAYVQVGDEYFLLYVTFARSRRFSRPAG